LGINVIVYELAGFVVTAILDSICTIGNEWLRISEFVAVEIESDGFVGWASWKSRFYGYALDDFNGSTVASNGVVCCS
jgi:hypothetical protein